MRAAASAFGAAVGSAISRGSASIASATGVFAFIRPPSIIATLSHFEAAVKQRGAARGLGGYAHNDAVSLSRADARASAARGSARTGETVNGRPSSPASVGCSRDSTAQLGPGDSLTSRFRSRSQPGPIGWASATEIRPPGPFPRGSGGVVPVGSCAIGTCGTSEVSPPPHAGRDRRAPRPRFSSFSGLRGLAGLLFRSPLPRSEPAEHRKFALAGAICRPARASEACARGTTGDRRDLNAVA